MSGLGNPNGLIQVYIANVPDFADYQIREWVLPMKNGEIADVGKQCGNGWRKVFNVFAKLVFELNQTKEFVPHYGTWQQLRDDYLLQEGSETCLNFAKPLWEDMASDQRVNIVMGKQFALDCQFPFALDWIDSKFALNEERKLIVCPYFDYRQLTNERISQLVRMIIKLVQPLSQSEGDRQ